MPQPEDLSGMKVEPIWSPSAARRTSTNMRAFLSHVSREGAQLTDYAGLHRFSLEEPHAFWGSLWDFLGIVGVKGASVLEGDGTILGTRWFPDARLNFAENHLRRRDAGIAIVALDEGGARREVSWATLYEQVGSVRSALLEHGVGRGDRVVAYLPNVPEAVVGALAATSIGAVWSSCSPDYPVPAVLDRFRQLAPKVLLCTDKPGRYNGKSLPLSCANVELAQGLPTLELLITVDADAAAPSPTRIRVLQWSEMLDSSRNADEVFERFPFDHPTLVLFSSGTTGTPKPIVHGAGGSLLQSMKEMVLHVDCKPDEPIFFPTTTGWMIWNLMLTGLAAGSPIVLYDGGPAFPDEARLFDIIATEGAGIARIVPPLLAACERVGIRPAISHDLSRLRVLTSGGSPLLPSHYEYVYTHVKSDLHLISPAGGTDIMATLATGNPLGPVFAGEIQCCSLGMGVQVFDERGRALLELPGELVCTRPFPSVPLGFWGAPPQRLVDEYFSAFPGVWRHGDWAEITARGGVIIHGRADATLKVSGIRIATTDIYRGVAYVSAVCESAAVGLSSPEGDRIVLFVVLETGHRLDQALRDRIRHEVRRAASPRHEPELIVQVDDLLRSMNGKPAEGAMRNAINGRAVSNRETLLNPALVPFFEQLALRRGSCSNDDLP